MILYGLLITCISLSGGWTLPGAGLSDKFNVGKFVQIEYGIAKIYDIEVFYAVGMARYPSITGALSLYTGFQGLSAQRYIPPLRFYLGLTSGVSVIITGENGYFFTIHVTARRRLSSVAPVFLGIGLPFYLRPDTRYLQSVYIGFSVGL